MLFFVIKVFILTILSFSIAFFLTPVLTHFLYKYKFGKKIRNDGSTPVFSSLHKKKQGTPTMGGILVWGTTVILAIGIFYLQKFTNLDLFKELNFLSRSQTLLPLGVLLASALVGFFDDILNIKGIGLKGGGLKVRHKLILYTIIAGVGAYWFFSKLDWDLIHLPFIGDFNIGFWYIPLFIFVIVATSFSVNETDGLDGLAGGVLLVAFAAIGVIAFVQGKFDVACLCGTIVGALTAFLWFNIYPARFFMGDTGSMSLGVLLGVLAMLTNTFVLLPIIGFMLVFESMSVIVQMFSKKIRGKKIFKSTPIHHHFEAVGWPEPKIVMRFWLISGIMATVGLIIFLTEKLL